MARRGWFGWVERNRQEAAVLGACVLLLVTGVAGIAAHSSKSGPSTQKVAADKSVDGETTTSLGGVGDTTSSTLRGSTSPTTTRGGTASTVRRATVGAIRTTPTVLPGTKQAPPCAATKGYTAHGLSESEVHIGQIVSDVNLLPQQLGPAHEGLAAYVKLINSVGGVCGRKLVLEYSNDNANPAQEKNDFQALAGKVFAFVGNESLQDGQTYSGSAPYEPTVKDGDEVVPDVGGLAFSTGRSQSSAFAGNVGSLSPTLTGGGQFKTIVDFTRAAGKPCTKGAVLYLREPTGASLDQSTIGQIALEAPWGGGLGKGNTKLYVADLAQSVPAYRLTVQTMLSEGMDCVFTYADAGSDANLLQAMAQEGAWPPDKCTSPTRCFRLAYVPFAAYDATFLQTAAEAARSVYTFIPHLPLNETSNPAMQAYLKALKAYKSDANPGTFSIIGFTAGAMFAESLGACGDAPTRKCLLDYLHALKGFNAGGLIGDITPFRTTRATYMSTTFDWKWIFVCAVTMQVSPSGGSVQFVRVAPKQGYSCDEMKIARSDPP